MEYQNSSKIQGLNYGLKFGAISPTDYFRSLPKDILVPEKDWGKYRPTYEPQFLEDGQDPQDCWVAGTENGYEYILKFLTGQDWNLSERFPYNGLNSEPTGGDPFQAGLFIHTNGIVDNDTLPTTKTYEEFATPRPLTPELLKKAKEIGYEFKQEYVWNDYKDYTSPEDKHRLVDEYLQYSPLGISVYAWVRDDSGLYYRPKGANDIHWCILEAKGDTESYPIFDTYPQDIKLTRKDMIDESAVCIRYWVKKIEPVNPQVIPKKTFWNWLILFLKRCRILK